MDHREDSTAIARAESLQFWTPVAYETRKEIAHSYNSTIGYKELALLVQNVTGVRTTQLIMNWIGDVLEITAQRAADSEEPSLTSASVRSRALSGSAINRDVCEGIPHGFSRKRSQILRIA